MFWSCVRIWLHRLTVRVSLGGIGDVPGDAVLAEAGRKPPRMDDVVRACVGVAMVAAPRHRGMQMRRSGGLPVPTYRGQPAHERRVVLEQNPTSGSGQVQPIFSLCACE